METVTTAVKNQDGVDVLPLSAYNPVNPVQGVIFDDEQYNSLKSQVETPVTDPAAQPPQDTPPAPVEAGAEPAEPVAGEPPVTPEPPAAGQDSPAATDFDAIIKEKTGGKFEKLDDLLKLSDKPTAEEIKFENEESRKVFEYLKQGKIDEVSTFLAQQQYLKNVDTFSGEELLRLKIQMTMPELSNEEIIDEYNDQVEKYGLDIKKEDFLSDDDYTKAVRKAQRRLKADLSGFVEDVKAFRSELKLPDLPTTQAPAQKSELDQLVEKIASEAGQNISPLQNIKLSSTVDKDVQVEHSFLIDEQQRSEASKVVTNYWADFKNRYSKEGGAIDYSALQRDIIIRDNFEKIVAAAAKEAYMKGRLGQALNLANATGGSPIPSGGQSPSDLSSQEYQDSLRRFIMST
jgi:hypothetical protein